MREDGRQQPVQGNFRPMDNRKRTYSLRMNVADMKKIQQLAQRLGTHESDVIRYAVKSMLTRLGPLHDPTVRGRTLLPVFLETGLDFFHHFDLDAARLEGIINDGVDDERRVDHEDIQLVAMTGIREPYVRWQLDDTRAGQLPRSEHAGDVEQDAGERESDTATRKAQSRPAETGTTLRGYLYEKYVYRGRGGRESPSLSDASLRGRLASVTQVGAAYSDHRSAAEQSRESQQTRSAAVPEVRRRRGPENS